MNSIDEPRPLVLCVLGTRPEAIKMAPVIHALRQTSWCRVRVLATAQHRDMMDDVLRVFGIEPDIDLDVMRPDQSLSALTASLLVKLDSVLSVEKPQAVLAQGDTTTTMTVALSCFYRRIPFGHVEAGLRSNNLYSPFPEEMNRVFAGRLARWHFAPTRAARDNLAREGAGLHDVFLTGNTVIDALQWISSREAPTMTKLPPGRRLILVTAHRRENFGPPLVQIFRAIRLLADRNEDVQVVYPVHPNPNVRLAAYEMLDKHARITLCEPMDYPAFVATMKRAYLILTDSGGVQEEAPALGKPVLLLRDETERPEAVTHGAVQLVGHDCGTIVDAAQRLLDDSVAYDSMARGVSPYGDGRAAARIVEVLRREFSPEAVAAPNLDVHMP